MECKGKARTLPRRKAPGPQVRQTVASMMRLVKANPLILDTNQGTKDCSADELRRKLPASIIDPFHFQSKSMCNDFTKKDKDASIFGRPSVPVTKHNVLPKKNSDVPPVITRTVAVGARPDVFRKPQVPARQNIKPALKRKSFSVENLPAITVLGPMNCTATQSMESLCPISPINNSRDADKSMSKSTKIRNSTPKCPKTPSLKELQNRLNNWLQKRNKLPTTFHHLKNIQERKMCIEMQQVIEQPLVTNADYNLHLDDKENTAAALNTEEVKKYSNDVKKVHIDVLVETLKELNVLIKEGYDPQHCQFWLKKISQRYANVEDISQFWECRAALEQASDNINEAIECYKSAIIHGAEIHGIDESLDKLFQKFGVLQLTDSMAYTPNTKLKVKNSNIIYNQFKSSIIQFAVLQKKMKNTSAHKVTSVVTPVRRSSRLAHIRTPNLRVSSTIKELLEDDKIEFERNDHLSIRYN